MTESEIDRNRERKTLDRADFILIIPYNSPKIIAIDLRKSPESEPGVRVFKLEELFSDKVTNNLVETIKEQVTEGLPKLANFFSSLGEINKLDRVVADMVDTRLKDERPDAPTVKLGSIVSFGGHLKDFLGDTTWSEVRNVVTKKAGAKVLSQLDEVVKVFQSEEDERIARQQASELRKLLKGENTVVLWQRPSED